MASLSKPEGYVTQDGHGHSLTFNICGPLSGSDCKDNPGKFVFFIYFLKYFYCIFSDFSDLPDMTGEYIVLSVVYSTG